nr:serine/arginine repetitive matrix protein 1-like [Aegilops tauschii subsp. strangulata]
MNPSNLPHSGVGHVRSPPDASPAAAGPLAERHVAPATARRRRPARPGAGPRSPSGRHRSRRPAPPPESPRVSRRRSPATAPPAGRSSSPSRPATAPAGVRRSPSSSRLALRCRVPSPPPASRLRADLARLRDLAGSPPPHADPVAGSAALRR